MSVGLMLQVQAYGGVVEWLMALVLKTSEVKASAGSNPAPSVLIGSNQVLENPQTQSHKQKKQAGKGVGFLMLVLWWVLKPIRK